MPRISGTVNGNGARVSGSANWESKREGPGRYFIDITNRAMHGLTPAVVVSGVQHSSVSSTAATDNVFTVIDISAESFRVRSKDVAGASNEQNQDAPFSFIAIA